MLRLFELKTDQMGDMIRQNGEEHVRLNPIIFAVIQRMESKVRFHGTESTLNLRESPVHSCHLFDAPVEMRGADHISTGSPTFLFMCCFPGKDQTCGIPLPFSRVRFARDDHLIQVRYIFMPLLQAPEFDVYFLQILEISRLGEAVMQPCQFGFILAVFRVLNLLLGVLLRFAMDIDPLLLRGFLLRVRFIFPFLHLFRIWKPPGLDLLPGRSKPVSGVPGGVFARSTQT